MDYFNYYGRDIDTKVKIAHSRRVFSPKPEDKTAITKKYLNNGFKLYISNDEVKERKYVKEIVLVYVLYSMYT